MREDLRKIIARLPVRDVCESKEFPTPPQRPRGYKDATSDGIPAPQRAKIRAACLNQEWPILLTGSVGTGKTCAAACIYGSFSPTPMWYRADDLLLSMSLGKSGSMRVESLNGFEELVTTEVPYSQFVGRVGNRSALFLDDLGTRPPTDSMYQALFDLLEWRKDKPLIITTNKTIGEIAHLYDDRIADRIATTIVTFTGKSQRQKHRRAQRQKVTQ